MLEWAWTKCARVRVFSATAHSAPVHPGAWSHGWVVPEEQSRGTAGMPRMRELGSGGAAGQSLGVLHQTLLLMASAGTLRPPPRCRLPTARSTPGCTQSPAPGTDRRSFLSPPQPGPGALPSSQMTSMGRGRESPSPFIAAGEVTCFCLFAPVLQLGKLQQRCWVLHRATQPPAPCSDHGHCPEPSRCWGSGCTPSPGRHPRSPRAAFGSWQQEHP